MPPLQPREPISRAEARIALWSALIWARENGSAGTHLSLAEWGRLVEALDPRETAVLALYGIRGLTFLEVGEWLGGLSRASAQILWGRALKKLARTNIAAELVA